MDTPISASLLKLASQYVDGQKFASTHDVLLCAMVVFGEFERRYHDELGQSLANAFHDIERGMHTTLKSKQDVTLFFNEIITAGRSNFTHGG